MTIKFRNLALSAAAALLFAFTASAQVTALEGIVKDESGKPIQGAVIKIERKDIKGNYSVKTDKKGHYGHYGLPIGTYKISVEVDGKVRDTVDNVRSKLGDPTPLNFDLHAAQQEKQATAAANDAGQLTKEQAQKMTPEQKAAFEKAVKQREADLSKNKALNDAYTAGKEALAAKNYDAAVDNLTKASELDASQNVIWSQLAEAYMAQATTKTGADQDAARQKGLDAYQKAIALKPDDAALENNYGLALVKAKKIPEAQEALNKAAQLDPPGAVRYYYNLGAVLVNANQTEAAGAAFQKAIAAYQQAKSAGNPPDDITKNFAEANYQYGIVLLSKANTDAKTGKVTPVDGTAQAFQTYLQVQPNGPFAESAKGMLDTIGGTVSTTYKNPDAETPAKKKTKK
ncbi:MAG: repeat-containing protein [Bryobacterales bacterium]|jgi:tetratricopeptide (TPR) repeat protein|nr:repeat-containing protein [Bryobacterales bacterium]